MLDFEFDRVCSRHMLISECIDKSAQMWLNSDLGCHFSVGESEAKTWTGNFSLRGFSPEMHQKN